MLDFTKEIALDKKKYRIYRMAQACVYSAAILAALYLADSVLFPSVDFNFSFADPASSRNGFVPQYRDGSEMKSGRIPKGSQIYFDTALLGNFSHVEISLTRDQNFKKLQNVKVEMRKSYQAFLYPEGAPIGFRDGTLIKNNGKYYIVSGGKFRQFGSDKIISAFGFPKDAFLDASDDDMKYNEAGEMIADSTTYPDFSIFKTAGRYYILENGMLREFVSQEAYLSRYEENQAIPKDESFIRSFTLSKEQLGFSDGSLVAYGTSGFVVSGKEILPISNAGTFVDKGFKWEDIKNISGDEFSLYSQALKHFSDSSPHPDGTIFLTSDTHLWYMVEGERKHPLPSDAIASTWIKGRSPVTVSSAGAGVLSSCIINEDSSGKTSCKLIIPPSAYQELPGVDYEFDIVSENDMKLTNIEAFFTQDMTKNNLKTSVLGLLRRIKSNYGSTQ
ncbi:MAG: hypothetical protein HGB08_02230 [Candidatus Moranbacteria bacterium]|nr:hypothetical protein [Candidatus Moranbacteria bacterium]